MKKVIIILCLVFLAICVLLAVLAPDFLSMLIIGVMTATIAAGLAFGLVPNLLYCDGFKTGQDSIDLSREVNADNVWTAVTSVKPFFRQKRLDDMFDTYMDMVKDQEEKGVVISDIEDVINDESLSIHSWRGVVLQISGILTALGLLGTFLGLVTGISTVAFTTAEATMESIENLLQGISTAFYTSIAGVILSILFNIAYRLVWNIMLREYSMFTEKFHIFIQPSADEQIRAKQYLNTEKMIETLNVIRTNSTMSLSRENVDPAQEQRMMIDILSGLRHGEFTFMLEPVCNLSDRNVVKAECKLQWNHPVLGRVQPSVYLPIVESDGFIAKLDQHIWDQVCGTLRDWIDSGVHPVPIVLDIRKTDLLAIDAFDTIQSLVDEYGLEPRNLEVAIDESAYIICHDEAKKAEKEFLQNGYKVNICNFTGNFVKLGKVDADELCLDLDLISADSDVESVFEQAAKAHLTVTCEGITSAKTLADVKKYGCLVGRGSHLYPEMSQADFAKLMKYTSEAE